MGIYIRFEEYEKAYKALEQLRISEERRNKIGSILLYSEKLMLKPPDVIALARMNKKCLDQIIRNYEEKYMKKIKPQLIRY